MFLSTSSIILASFLAVQTSGLSNESGPLRVAKATFPQFGTNKEISGTLEFHALPSNNVEIVSTGVNGLKSFPAGQGPFVYHSTAHRGKMNAVNRIVHMNAIPAENGSCAAAGPHLDPLSVGDISCNALTPNLCQVFSTFRNS